MKIVMDQKSSNDLLASQAQILKKLFADSSSELANLFLEANEKGVANYDRGRLELYKAALAFLNQNPGLKYVPFEALFTELQNDIDTTTSPDAQVEQTLKFDGFYLKNDKKRLPPTFFERDNQSDEEDEAKYNARKIKTNND